MGSVLKSGGRYHVFLSFRGEDIRNNFLGHLYTALDQKGIYTYVDSKELKKGEQIDLALMKAIEESQIVIIIFSKDYASSWWCLEELVKIIDCKKERDLMVFPLFYKVEPRELRTPRGSYRDAMVKHGSKYGKDSKEVKRWEKALSDASYLSGWPLKDGDESELIQKIVMEISIHLNRTLLHVAMHPVGIDSRMAELKSMINLESNDNVLMVGLWGQGGIGKTTLAKAIYNDIFNQFDNSCFLANVREVSKDCKDLVALQEKLLFETLALKERLAVSNVDRGINLIQERLCQKKVLLILDDVNDLCQLQALVGEGKWFHNGSRIIITTRDSHLLTYLGIDQDHVYKVRELDDNDARELFSKHAFSTHQNFKIRTNLVDSVLNHAKGLPLALEVLGSFLCGRRECEWESALDDISTAPKKGINDVLKISYSGLEPKVKEIFLHIACFFKGWNSEYVKKVLNTCDLNVVIGLEILKERSLIRIELRRIHMHDLIQLMGMHIVNQESDDPRRRSRLWLYNDIVNVVSSEMENCAVKAIVLDPPKPTEIFVGPDALTKMRTLRLLILLNVHNTFQDPICVPNELRWFRWDGCAPPVPEYSYGEKKLAGLDMSHSSITVVPNQFKGFQNLKYINFSFCKLLVRMPDLSCTSNLKELDFSYCKNLVETHESIAYLDKLEVLNLASCSELSVFPNVLKSKNLRRLNFNHCMKFERFPDIPHKLEGLKELDFHSTAIKELPLTSIENLVALKIMSLHHCKNLVNLPSTIYKLQNLEELTIWSSPNLIGFPKYEDSADPCMKAGLPNLRHLSIVKCNLSEVEFLENLSCFPLLNELDLEENNITALPSSINRRDSLSKLLLSNCHQLQEIPELPPFLTHFFADNCESLQKYEDLIPIHHIVRASLGIDTDEDVPKFILPQGEMPQWVFPIERDSVFFMVSKDLYDKIIGVAFCAILKNDEKVGDSIYCYDSYVNGKRINSEEGRYDLSDLDHIAIEYLDELWGEVDFAQIDGHYIQFGVGVRGRVVKKWGVRIICKQLGDDLKAELRDNQLIDLALLYEVDNGSTDSAAMSSHVHKENSSEANLREDLQDCQMGTEEHSEIASKRKYEFNLPLGKRIKTMWTSIFDRWRGAW